LFQVGTILHQAKSGRLIVRLTREVKAGTFVYDDARRKVGRMVELIGPVRAPYGSIAVVTSRLGKPGDPVFMEG
jgi:RNA-binding protein